MQDAPNPVFVQIIIALIGIIGACIGAFVIIKIAIAESKKDIMWTAKQLDKVETQVDNHISSASHPSRDQIDHLSKELNELKSTAYTIHRNIEQKVDDLRNIIMKWKDD